MTGEFIKCGATMPSGGCTKATGEVLVIENNYARQPACQ